MARALGGDVLFLGGGTELVLLMKLGLAAPAHIIDLKSVPGLDAIDTVDGQLEVGALVTHSQVEQHPSVRNYFPELARVSSIIANRRVRGSGTLAGNLCFADPHSDPATLLTAMGASLVIAGPGDETRNCSLAEFWTGPYSTTLSEGEFVTAVHIPIPALNRVAHERFKLKERPAVTLSVVLEFDGDRISSARAVVGSAVSVPQRLSAMEDLLLSDGAGDPRSVAAAAAAEVDPLEDQDGSSEYKRHLVGVLASRAVMRVLDETDERNRR